MFKINKVAKNFLSVSLSNILSQVFIFLVGTYYAHRLTTEGFGNVTLVQAFMVYFTLFTLFGLQTYGTREVSKDVNSVSLIAGNILTLRFIIFIISYLFIFIMSFAFKNDSVFRGLLLLYGVTLLPSALNIDWIFFGLQKMHYNAVYNIIKSLIPFVLVAIFLKTQADIFIIPIVTFIGLLLGFIYQFYIYFFKEKLKIRIHLNKEIIISLILYGMPFLISGILATVNCNVDRIIIGFTRGKSEAGIYASSYYIIFFLMNVVAMIFTPIFPILINLYHLEKKNELKKLCDNTARIIIMIVTPIVVGGIILSKGIISNMFGIKYESGSTAFSILLIYIFLLFIREVYGYGLNAWNMEKRYLKIVTVSSVANLLLNLILTPLYGMNIAALVTVFSEVINFILMRSEGEKIIHVNFLKYILRIVAPTILMSAIVFLFKCMNVNVFVNISAAAVIYFIGVLMFRYISLNEIKGYIALKKR